MREVKLLSELDHPHVVQYIDSFTEAGCVHMVSRKIDLLRLPGDGVLRGWRPLHLDRQAEGETSSRGAHILLLPPGDGCRCPLGD